MTGPDDLEDEENIRTEESRARTERWLTGTLLPALHPTKGKVRFAGTAIHPKSLILKKCNDPKWKAKVFPDDPTWRLGDTYHTAIGQYGTQITPLQAVREAAAIANGGYLLTPTLLASSDSTSSPQA